MKNLTTFATATNRFLGWLARTIVGLVSALAVIVLGLLLILIAVGMATDGADRVTTSQTVVQSTKVVAPTGTPITLPGPQLSTEDSKNTVTVTKNAVGERSDSLIVALLVAGILLLLLGLFWGRVTSVEVGPSGLKLAIDHIKERAAAAKTPNSSNADKSKIDAAALEAIEKLIQVFGRASSPGDGSSIGTRRVGLRSIETPTRRTRPPMAPVLTVEHEAAVSLGDFLFDAALDAQRQAPGTDPKS